MRKLTALIVTVAFLLAFSSMALAGTPNLVLKLTFDEEPTDVVLDSSGNELHGTIHGSPSWVEGKIGMALEFDGENDYIVVPDDEALHLDTAFTVMAWIKVYEIEHCAGVVLRGNQVGWGPDYHFRIALLDEAGAQLTWGSGDHAGTEAWFHGGFVDPGEWMHVAYTADEEEQLAFVDGEIWEMRWLHGLPPWNVEGYETYIGMAMGVGGDLEQEAYFSGIIDEVRVYDGVLTEEQIQQVMAGGEI